MTRVLIESTDKTVLLDENINGENQDEFDKKLEYFNDREIVSMKFVFVPGIKIGSFDNIGDLNEDMCSDVLVIVKAT